MKSFVMELKSTFFHLRFNISFAFLPLFLWGYVLSGADITARFWLGILILHLLIYPGMNGIYAYFDKRKGLISGLWDIKPASKFTFSVSLIFLLAGIFISFGSNCFYALTIATLLFVLFSLPFTGIKSKPFWGILVLSFSYAIAGFGSGWLCGTNLNNFFKDLFNIVGFISAVTFVAGFYTLSLVYRISEDSERKGDHFIENLGETRAFGIAKVMLSIAGVTATVVVAGRFTLYELIGIILYFLIGFLAVDRFEKNFHLQKEMQNYRTVLSFNITNSTVLSVYLLFRIIASHFLFID
jgi:hypothetical protein